MSTFVSCFLLWHLLFKKQEGKRFRGTLNHLIAKILTMIMIHNCKNFDYDSDTLVLMKKNHTEIVPCSPFSLYVESGIVVHEFVHFSNILTDIVLWFL